LTDGQGLGTIKIDARAHRPSSVPADAPTQTRVNLNDAISVLKSIVGLVYLSPCQPPGCQF